MTPTPKLTSGATAGADGAGQNVPAAQSGPFVLNLCSSTTPMALPKAEQPELKRFSFFVSRRFEEGRERFRLHMGYFSTLAEAEEWLGAVRDIYPGAWAGEAPGKKLRERAVAAAAAQARHAAGPPPDAATTRPASKEPVAPTARSNLPMPKPAVNTRPAQQSNPPAIPVARPAPRVPGPEVNVPTLQAAGPSVARATAPVPTDKPATVRPASVARPAGAARLAVSGAVNAAPRTAAVSVPRPAPTQPSQAVRNVPVTTQRVAATARVAPLPAPGATSTPLTAPAARPAVPLAAGPTRGNSQAGIPARNLTQPPQIKPSAAPVRVAPVRVEPVRTAAAAAGVSRPTGVPRPALKSANKPLLPNSNVREVLAALSESPQESTGETRMMPAPVMPPAQPADDAVFTDTQVLKFLEMRRADGNTDPGVEAETGAISLLKPDDTGTRRALKQAVVDNAAVSFAVQLQWSVQPIELAKVPPLAIFSAYTLYTVEGSRDGRRWYGLRLGFFSDAISAKQVAYYVRSEFTSVAVVPVSPQEHTRASDVDKKGSTRIGSPIKTRPEAQDEFKLIDPEDVSASAPAAVRKAGKPQPASSPVQAAAPAKSGAKGSRVRARERRGPQTLEETLEILGASELEIDAGTGETLNESGVRHLRVEVQKNTPFSRLLERLSERVRKS
ncbi:MAG TPA: hypothetical protein VFB37_07395 [Steroidobacteraceae bacterium]|nr:hypothetical protein [Steroidobacteraceae bacterium]